MHTIKRYLRLYRVLIFQFFKTVMQSKIDFLMGLFGFFFTQLAGILFLYLVFEQIPDLQGWTLEQLIFIYGFAQLPRGIDHLLTDNIWMVAWRLVINGDFEDSTNGWKMSTAASVVTGGYSGSAIQLNNPSAWSEAARQDIAVEAFETYTLTWRSKRVSGTGVFNMEIAKAPYDGSKPTITHVTNYTWMNDTSGNWVEHKTTIEMKDAKGHMVVDIGGGTTNVAVLSMNGVVLSSSLRIAGDYFDEVIARYVRRKYNMIIGQVTAEAIKINLGQVYPSDEEVTMDIKGRDFKTGKSQVITMTSTEVFEILQRHAAAIADEINDVLSRTGPELVSDIAENGITLTGGGSQIYGMDKLLTESTGIRCTLADDADSCVAYGCGKSLAWITRMSEGPINLARKRLMRE